MEVDDRLSHLEQRLQLQEDEIQLLKAALADALRRLGHYEEQTHPGPRRPAPTKGQGSKVTSGWGHCHLGWQNHVM